jgi:excisionase family DNA binding protein
MTGAVTTALALRPREAARALGISERTLWEWTKAGRVPSVRVGHVVMYPTDALKAWLAQQAAPSKEGHA